MSYNTSLLIPPRPTSHPRDLTAHKKKKKKKKEEEEER
jgi:hypothetical protein